MGFADYDVMARPSHDPSPDAVYLGSLTRNRVCYCHSGKKLKVLSVTTGFVTVRMDGRRVIIKDRSFVRKKTTDLAPSAVVYLKNPLKKERS